MTNRWKKNKLIDLCSFYNGLWKGEKPPFVNVGVIRNTNFASDGCLRTTDIAFLDVEENKLRKRKLQYGDIILEKSGGGPKQPVGRVVLFNLENGIYSFSNFTTAIRVLDNSVVDYHYLHKYLHWIYVSGVTENMQSNSTGIRNLNFNIYKEIEISYPSLPEQKRIVGIIDNTLRDITIAKIHIENNLNSVRALFESYLQSIFSEGDKNWKRLRLGSIVERLTNGFVGPTRNIYQATGVPYLLARHVKNNRLTFDGKTFISEAFNNKNKKSILKTGDVLLVQSGHIGHSAVVPPSHEGHNCHAMIVITPMQDIITGKFLSTYFLSPSMRQQFESLRTGSTIKHLNCQDIRELQVPVPSMVEQQKIVDQIEQFSNKVHQLITLYKIKCSKLDELKKTVLYQAFTGNL